MADAAAPPENGMSHGGRGTAQRLTVVICTHNRAALLQKVLASLDAAVRPDGMEIGVLVIANACSDGTLALLQDYPAAGGQLPLRFEQEPVAGKSHALNRAIGLVERGFLAFVDDDHRVDPDYFSAIARAIREYPSARMFCGRIIPDWTGAEPAWIHDQGRYRIYPLPVPHFEMGDAPLRLDPGMKIPGGGNLVVERSVFSEVGGFSTELGPKGHDLAGSEDSDLVLRALAAGVELRYIPAMVQYHYVDLERLRLGYLVRKSYQRTRTLALARGEGGGRVPRYLWKQLALYLLQLLSAPGRNRRRFFMMRVASTLGEISGRRHAGGASS